MQGATVTGGRKPAFDDVMRAASAVVCAERMAMRKPAPKRTRVEGEIRAAGKRLAAMHDASPVEIDGPTPERMRQAGADCEISESIRSVEVTKGGERRVEQIRTPRVRVGEDPFTRMLHRGELDPACEVTNKVLGDAGLRYRRLHEAAGRSEIRAQDFTKGFTTASGPTAKLDAMLDAWSGWDKARAAVGPEMRAALDGVVLEGRKPDEVGAGLSRYTDAKKLGVVGLTALRFALAALDRHFAAVDRAAA